MSAFRWTGRIKAQSQLALVVCLFVVIAQFLALTYALHHSQSGVREISHHHTTTIATIERFEDDLTHLSYRILGVVGGIYAAPNIAHEIPRLGDSVFRNFQRVTQELGADLDSDITARARKAIADLPRFLDRTERLFRQTQPAPTDPERRRLERHHDEWLDIRPALTLFAEAVRTRAKENASRRLQELEAIEGRLTGLGVVSLILGIAGLGLTWYLLIFLIARPVTTLVSAMRRVATGDTTALVPNLGDTTELGDMARAVQVFKDKSVENRRLQAEEARQRTELARARDEAEAANRTKSEFLANMSHELRTPLNAIIGFSDVMAQELLGPIGNEKYRGYAKDTLESGRHLLQIINDILDISKVEAGQLELREEAVDLADVFKACLRLVNERATDAGVTVTGRIDADVPYILVDTVRIKQIVLNLLSNAVKFTPTNGRVSVSARLTASGGVLIEVSDTGIGMSPAEVELALLPFRQIDSRLARRYEGTGLGLPLTKALVMLHDGALRIDSESGKGTTVAVDFPAARSLARKPRATNQQLAAQSLAVSHSEADAPTRKGAVR